MSDADLELSESDKADLRDAMKEAWGNALQNTLGGAAGAFFAVVAVRLGVVPFAPARLSTVQLAGFATVLGIGSAVLYVTVSRPHENRLNEKFEELDEET